MYIVLMSNLDGRRSPSRGLPQTFALATSLSIVPLPRVMQKENQKVIRPRGLNRFSLNDFCVFHLSRRFESVGVHFLVPPMSNGNVGSASDIPLTTTEFETPRTAPYITLNLKPSLGMSVAVNLIFNVADLTDVDF